MPLGSRVLEDVPPLTAAARVASIAFGTNGTGPIKRSFTAKLREKGKVHERVVYVLQCVQQKSATTAICPRRRRAGPAIKPAGGSRPRTTAVRDDAPAGRSRPPTPSRYADRSCMRSFVWPKRPRRHPRSRCVARARGGPRPSISRPAGGFDPSGRDTVYLHWCVPRRRHPAGWWPARAGADLVATGLCVQIGRGARRLLF
jgi:hypothetical protein